MDKKLYLITNLSEGSICVTGRQRIDIPGKCQDMQLLLPANTAKQTISRLKQRYPLLKIREAEQKTQPASDLPALPTETTSKKSKKA